MTVSTTAFGESYVWHTWVDEYYSSDTYHVSSETTSSSTCTIEYDSDGCVALDDGSVWLNSIECTVSSDGTLTAVSTYDVESSIAWNNIVTKYYESSPSIEFREPRRRRTAEEEQRAAEESRRRAEEAERRYAEIQKKKEKAEETAIKLLEILIGKDQAEIYRKSGKLFIKGKDADYVLMKDDCYNIRKIKNGKVRKLCAHIDKYKYPPTDNMISLMFALRENEKKLIKLANDHGVADDYHEGDEVAVVNS